MLESNSAWLINLPHAGGSTTLFKRWNKKILCNILNIEYPGHWTRMEEPLIDTFDKLAEDVLSIINDMIPKQSVVYLFGHSIGAIMSWYISPILTQQGYNVKGLFLSASQNPGAFPEQAILQSNTDRDMLRLIEYKTAEHDEVINAQFMRTFLPILKNDIQVCKSFISDGHYVDVDSIVLYGDEDKFTDVKEMKKWEKYVRLVSMQEYHGTHLYLEDKENIEKITTFIDGIINKS